jgi:hypothetical protein
MVDAQPTAHILAANREQGRRKSLSGQDRELNGIFRYIKAAISIYSLSVFFQHR